MREAPLTMDFMPQPDLAPANQPELQFLSTEYRHPLAQQAQGLHGVGGIPAFTQQAYLPGGHIASTQNHAPNLNTVYSFIPLDARYNTELARTEPSGPVFAASAASTAPAPPMGPPTQPRKKKARTLRADDWEPYKAQIIELHITQKLPLRKVKEMIKEEFGFTAE